MAVTKYLDKTGLTYFWGKIKAWCNSLFALDTAVVHKTDNESISGTKTFSNQIVGIIGKSYTGYVDMLQTYQSDNNNYRSCTIRCINDDGYNEMLLGVHDESNNAPGGISIRSTNGTLTGAFGGSMQLTRTTDASGTSDNSPALSIGSLSGTHLELDGNELMAKSSGTATGTLYLNGDGGDVYIGGNTANYKSVTGRGKGSSTVPVYTDANGIVTACGSTLDVGISGTAAKASRDGDGNVIASYYCTLSTDQNVSSTKTFLDGNALATVSSVIDRTDTTSTTENQRWPIWLRDKNSVNIAGIGYSRKGDSGYDSIKMRVRNIHDDWADLIFRLYDNGESYITFEGKPNTAVNFTGLRGNASTATKLATARTINGVSFDGSANITVADSTKVAKEGDTMTGTLYVQPSNVNISVEPSAQKEDYRFAISKNSADTTHNGNLMRLGVAQAANTKDYRILLGVSNPRSGNLPTSASIAGGTDDSDASTSNCWGSIGLFYDYSKNKTFPVLFGCSAYPTNDDSGNSLATTAWVRSATGNFACNAATASAFASSKSVTLTGAVTGTVSSTGGWSVSTLWRSCTLGRSDNSSSNPWFKVASCNCTASSNSYSITFLVENCNTSTKAAGVLRARVSLGSDKIIGSTSTEFSWIVNDGFALEDFVLVCPTTAEPTVELWARFSVGYLRRRFTVLSEGMASSTTVKWTLFDTVSAGQEASISTQGTQVVSSLSSYDAELVHKAGTESIAGTKTFSDAFTTAGVNFSGDRHFGIAVKGSGAGAYLQINSVTSGKSIKISNSGTDTISINSAGSIEATGDVTAASFTTTGSINLNSTSTIGVYKGNATSIATVSGGSALDKGARLSLYGESRSSNPGRFELIASSTSTTVTLAGGPGGTLSWNGQNIQTSSDERLKTPLFSVPNAILDAWEEVNWGQFQYLDAIASKGESARLHLGLIAQHIMSVFEKHGLDVCAYGILCHEEDDGEGKDIWMVRYAEALAMEAAYQRHKNKILENRISELEKQVSDMIILLQNLTNSNG